MYMTVKATQYPQVYEDLGIDPSNLGCIMLDTEPIVISDLIRAADLLDVDASEHPHMQGIVSENVPHCTVLYGLLRPGPELRKHVDVLLGGWMPAELSIDDVAAFEIAKYDAVCVVAKLDITKSLLEGNGRLRLLPHVDTFSDYTPHITLAYLKASSDWQSYIEPLSERLRGAIVKTVGLNYGD